MLVGALAVAVLAVHDASLVWVQLQPTLDHACRDRVSYLTGLHLRFAVHDGIIRIAFEPDLRELPTHPYVERIVQIQVRQQG